jgi:hypothetical protein
MILINPFRSGGAIVCAIILFVFTLYHIIFLKREPFFKLKIFKKEVVVVLNVVEGLFL